MYILVNLDRYYPSVLHFDSIEEALAFADKNTLNDEYESFYVAKIEYSHIGEESEKEENEDIEWGLYKD